MKYIKTIVSADNEIKYIKLQLLESKGYVDKIIICEFDHTHTGSKREFIFEKYLNDETFTLEEKERIVYLKGNVGKWVRQSENDSKIFHANEKLFRGYFARHIRLKPNDIIISVDADEIIFARMYSTIFGALEKNRKNIVRLPLYQFFYKPTYLWENLTFLSPVACKAKHYWFRYPAQWRDEGEPLDEFVGCHFSWLLTVDEMIAKLSSYAHAADYSHLASRDILENAIKQKEYPFDPNREFKIKEINYLDNPEYYPNNFGRVVNLFKYLM